MYHWQKLLSVKRRKEGQKDSVGGFLADLS